MSRSGTTVSIAGGGRVTGTRFESPVRSPMQAQLALQNRGPSKVAEPLVYVVDDDAMVCRGVERLLETIGLSCQVFTSGDEFLAMVDLERTGCAILDVRLHGVNGLEIQRRLTARGAILPVIFLTGHAEVPVAVR